MREDRAAVVEGGGGRALWATVVVCCCMVGRVSEEAETRVPTTARMAETGRMDERATVILPDDCDDVNAVRVDVGRLTSAVHG